MDEFQDVEVRSVRCEVCCDPGRPAREDIRRRIQERVAYYAAKLDEIQGRLDELEDEWDVERALETHAAMVGIVGVALSTLSRKWLILPVVISLCMLRHTFGGWSLPQEMIRRFGFRTADEINTERFALKALRGDFKDVNLDEGDCIERSKRVLEAVRRRG
ncbi:MAG: hypothetical protein FWE88_08450 [Phycisphaerae bacterium]|nr:hypothetical protein [Phycisphaerae bacterium]